MGNFSIKTSTVLMLLASTPLLGQARAASFTEDFPLRTYTEWVYENQAGQKQTTHVLALTHVKYGDLVLPAAQLLKNTGHQRYLLRSDHRQIECLFDDSGKQVILTRCHPSPFFKWPLKEDVSWHSQSIAFVAQSPGAASVLGKDMLAYRIQYMGIGEAEPMGEFTVVPSIGLTAFEEDDERYDLKGFEPGSGAPLEAIDDATLDLLLGTKKETLPYFPAQPPLSGAASSAQTLPQWMWFLLALPVIFGLALLQALRKKAQPEFASTQDSKTKRNLIYAMLRGGQLDQAKAEIDKLLERFPNYPDLYFLNGEIERSRQNHKLAQNAYSQALSINPGYVEAKLALAQMLQSQKQYSAALIHLRSVLNDHPDYWDVQLMAAHCETRLGDWAKAQRRLKNIIRAKPDLQKAHELLELCKSSAQKSSAAR